MNVKICIIHAFSRKPALGGCGRFSALLPLLHLKPLNMERALNARKPNRAAGN